MKTTLFGFVVVLLSLIITYLLGDDILIFFNIAGYTFLGIGLVSGIIAAYAYADEEKERKYNWAPSLVISAFVNFSWILGLYYFLINSK